MKSVQRHRVVKKASARKSNTEDLDPNIVGVKPDVKTNKSDYIDAEAIAEAVARPTMRFVPIKTDDQLDLQSLHRVRERWPPP
jgi:transposase